MMKKIGFTLSEVLITLGIIGVVAALTAPALVNNTSNAQVGPKLAKVVSTIENANRKILMDAAVTKLGQATNSISDYYEKLSTYISGSSYETEATSASDFNPQIKFYDGSGNLAVSVTRMFKFSDGTVCISALTDGSYIKGIKGSYLGRYATMYIDINGPNIAPNTVGKDIFLFIVDQNGSLIPRGSSTDEWLNGESYNYKYTGNIACNENTVGTGIGCAGSIFDNNLKVIYR